MAGEIENEDDVLELGEEPNDTQPAADGGDTQEGAEADDIEIPTFDDPSEGGADDTNLVKHLRDQIRDRDRRLKEVEQAEKPTPEIVVGDKPTLDSCEYDEDKFEQELTAWHERKRQADEQANAGKEAKRQADEQWQSELAEYAKKRAALPYRDVEDAEGTVVAALSQAQQALVVKSANDPAKLIYALGKHPTKLAALAAVSDPIKFIAATVRLEAEIRMAKRSVTIEPDRPLRGSASMSTTAKDEKLEKLEKEARQTGNRTKLVAYKKELARKAA